MAWPWNFVGDPFELLARQRERELAGLIGRVGGEIFEETQVCGWAN